MTNIETRIQSLMQALPLARFQKHGPMAAKGRMQNRRDSPRQVSDFLQAKPTFADLEVRDLIMVARESSRRDSTT
jgi:hypothetical protein